MKITLENISAYLPYGLKVINIKSGKILNVLTATNSETGVDYSENGSAYYPSLFWKIVPILRPISDLTKPITVDGVEQIPIVELAKIAYPEKKWIKSGLYAKSIDYEGFDKYEFMLNVHVMSFTIHNIRRTFTVRNQLALFQWLFKHRFDVFGLIDAGLAVDLNTLEINPYN